jgi:hypothetical protein
MKDSAWTNADRSRLHSIHGHGLLGFPEIPALLAIESREHRSDVSFDHELLRCENLLAILSVDRLHLPSDNSNRYPIPNPRKAVNEAIAWRYEETDMVSPLQLCLIDHGK